MNAEQLSPQRLPFRPRARVLQLLGEELIGSPRLAVFELVKNAYDACAHEVTVWLQGIDTDEPWIEVRDDGDGMDRKTIKTIWMVPGHDHRKRQRAAEERSHCDRLPLGEKGLGRFAAHKLGDHITLVTRAADQLECVVEIDWEELSEKEFLSDALVEIRSREPEIFTADETGTLIQIRRLKPPKFWARGEVRRLHRQIMSICSPFESPTGFSAEFKVPGRESWVEDIPRVSGLINSAFWHFGFLLDEDTFAWAYEFRPTGLKLEGRSANAEDGEQLLLPEIKNGGQSGKRRRKRKKIKACAEDFAGIGSILGAFYVYDRDKEVLAQLPESQMLKAYLDSHGGVQVFRDGIRVYNYGEPGDDWLGLDLRRVQNPTRKLSRNLVIGAIHLSLADSLQLREKTNREGFVENDAFLRLQDLVTGVLATLERERYPDKSRIRQLFSKEKSEERRGLQRPLEELRRELKKAKVHKRCERYLQAVERRYTEMKENLLRPAGAGLNLSLVFHEVERGVRELLKSVRNREKPEHLERQARDMAQLLDNFSSILRRNASKKHPIASLVDRSRRINLLRFKVHNVALRCELSMDSNPGFLALFPFGLVLGALSNLVDNAIYWMRVRWPEEPGDWESSPRRIFIGTSDDFTGGPSLIVADTGPGFRDDPEDLVRAFYTRKPDGMGIGLYYTNLVMELCGGRLIFPQRGDVELPNEFDGAVVALQFPEVK